LSHIAPFRYNRSDIAQCKRDATTGAYGCKAAPVLNLDSFPGFAGRKSTTGSFVPSGTIWQIRYNLKVITLFTLVSQLE
jgi:hypothetical protein